MGLQQMQLMEYHVSWRIKRNRIKTREDILALSQPQNQNTLTVESTMMPLLDKMDDCSTKQVPLETAQTSFGDSIPPQIIIKTELLQHITLKTEPAGLTCSPLPIKRVKYNHSLSFIKSKKAFIQ